MDQAQTSPNLSEQQSRTLPLGEVRSVSAQQNLDQGRLIATGVLIMHRYSCPANSKAATRWLLKRSHKHQLLVTALLFWPVVPAHPTSARSVHPDANQRLKPQSEHQCTPIPSLYEDWKKAIVGKDGTDEQARTYAESQRAHVSELPDPFTKVGRMSPAERTAADERVLWEDETIFVLVDKYRATPSLLVIPKEPVIFPIDAPSDLIKRLGQVAAVTGDAMIFAVGKTCQAVAKAAMYINPPGAVSVRQMHVHVEPSIGSFDGTEPYGRAAEYLKTHLPVPPTTHNISILEDPQRLNFAVLLFRTRYNHFLDRYDSPVQARAIVSTMRYGDSRASSQGQEYPTNMGHA